MKTLATHMIFLLVGCAAIAYLIFVIEDHSVAMTVINDSEVDVAMCWMNSYNTESEVSMRSPKGCYLIDRNDEIRLNTYVGHRFLILPKNPRIDRNDNYFLIASKNVLSTKVSTLKNIYNHINFSLSSKLEFRVFIDNLWSTLLRYRLIVITSIVSTIILFELISPKTKVNNTNTSQVSQSYPAIPRNSLKCYAVITMLLNHFGHICITDKLMTKLYTIPATAGGSFDIFMWLVGYNTSQQKYSESAKILIVFLVLELFVALPSPFSYSSLVTAVAIRYITNSKWFAYNNTSKSCLFADYHILYHMLLCMALISCENVLNADGIRLLEVQGLLAGIAGRLFNCTNPVSLTDSSNEKKGMKESDAFINSNFIQISKLFVWTYALFLMKSNVLWLAYLQQEENLFAVTLRNAYLYLVLAVFVVIFLVLLFPCKKPLWSKSSRVAKVISHYSLEIYFVHLVLGFLYLKYTSPSSIE